MNIPDTLNFDRATYGTSQFGYGPNLPQENVGPWLDTVNRQWYVWGKSGYQIVELSDDGKQQLKAWEASIGL